MATNPSILATDYNVIQNNVQTVLGTYYGQGVSSSAISVPVTNQNSTKITALQWQNLYKDLLTAYNHQNAANGTLTYPTTAITIKYSDYQAYSLMGTTVLANYSQFLSGYSANQGLTTGTQAANTWGSPGKNTVRHRVVLTFPSTAAVGYFFNSGGRILFSASLTGGQTGVTTKDYSWNSMLDHMGTIYFGLTNAGTIAGAVTPGNAQGIGIQNLNSSNQLIYQKNTENATYSPNQYDIFANLVNNVLTFYAEFEDRSGTATAYTVDETVSGVITSTVRMSYASGGVTGYTMDVSAYLPSVTASAMEIVDPYSP